MCRDNGGVSTTLARVLLVEDDAALRESIAAGLSASGFLVTAEPDGTAIDDVVKRFRPDIGVLDVRLPSGPDGFEIARRLRDQTSIPVLFITAADSLEDRLRGFDAGADDYVVKPFALAELLARLRAILRRSGRLNSAVIEIRDLVVDETDHVAHRAGLNLKLTDTEFELLRLLARSPGRVFSKAQLLSLVWQFDNYDPNLVEVHMSALRRKMEAHGPRLIHTVRGAGYELRP